MLRRRNDSGSGGRQTRQQRGTSESFGRPDSLLQQLTASTWRWRLKRNRAASRKSRFRLPCSVKLSPSVDWTLLQQGTKCADTTGTVPVPWAGHFQCWNFNILLNKIHGINFIKQLRRSRVYGRFATETRHKTRINIAVHRFRFSAKRHFASEHEQWISAAIETSHANEP